MAKNPKPWGKWGIKLDSIKESGEEWDCLEKKWRDSKSMQESRTAGFEFFTKVSHNLNLYSKDKNIKFSEGSTQTIKRKIRAQTIQRVPDGEIVTQYDKNSIEQVIIEYLFRHKILQSEFDGKDMMKQLWRCFNESYDYGFACVRTGFEKDLDGDPRISFTLIPWGDVFPSSDCKFIEEADWYFIREYIPRSTLKNLLNEDGSIKDPTYNEEVVQYLIENEIKDGADTRSVPTQDKKKGVTPVQSIEVRTFYRKGADEFVTYVPSISAVLRRVKNEDPRKDVPLHFLILEPDPEFPLGCSSVMWTLAQQQFADAFQSTAYQTLLLSLHPPLQVFGNFTNPQIKMKPNAIWKMGTNDKNKIEPYRVETTTLTQYGSILENVSGKMMQSLNVTDATVASDANVAHYSATPQGVEQQRVDKTITINQYQKRVEIFFQEWANHALRSYISSMNGTHDMTVDERTRRRIWDIEQNQGDPMDPEFEPPESIVDGNKISIDFDNLSADLLSFEVRVGSLIENERDIERRNIQEMLIPVSQMMGNISDQNRDAFEQVIMQLVMRLLELSDIDISVSASDKINNKLLAAAMQNTMQMVIGQQQQISQLQQAMGQPGPTGPNGEPAPIQGPPPEEMPPQTAPAAPVPQEPVTPEAAEQPVPEPVIEEPGAEIPM